MNNGNCDFCGKMVAPNASFCPSCGNRFEISEATKISEYLDEKRGEELAKKMWNSDPEGEVVTCLNCNEKWGIRDCKNCPYSI